MRRFFIVLLFIFFCLLGCGKKAQAPPPENNKNIQRLRAITIGVEPANGMNSIYEKLDELTIDELGCTLRFGIIAWGDERRQINLAIASGEYDFITNGNFSDYRIMASRNAFLNINDYLHLTPDLTEHYMLADINILERSEIDGKLYGIPQYSRFGLMNSLEGFFYREDLRKEWDLEPITSFETLEAYLYRAKQDSRYANKPLITDNRVWTSLWYMLGSPSYLEIVGVFDTPFTVASINEPYNPVSRMNTVEFFTVLEYLKKWYDDGILEPQLLAVSNNEGSRGLELMKADEKPCETNSPIWAVNNWYVSDLYNINSDWEFEFYDYRRDTSPAYKTIAGVATTISVSSKTRYPETAVKLLEKLHTDQRYYDILIHGVAGEHYFINEHGIYFDGISSEQRFRGWTGATDDLLKHDSYISVRTQWHDVMDREDRLDAGLLETAPLSPYDGFGISIIGLEDVIDRLDAVKAKYFQPLLCGVTDDLKADYEHALFQMEAAGIEEYLDILRGQLQKIKR